MTEKKPETVRELSGLYGYWKEHPSFSVEDWKYEVANSDTRQGYWEFVAAQLGITEI